MARFFPWEEGGSAKCVLITDRYQEPCGDEVTMTLSSLKFCSVVHTIRNTLLVENDLTRRTFLETMLVAHKEQCTLMPRYFFHVYHEGLQVDRVGEELPDKNAAWKEATATAGRLLQDVDGELLLSKQPWRLEVTDEFATPLFELWIGARRST